MNGELKKREEEKRERCWDPRARWRIIQESIRWVDSQQVVPRNSRQACLANQARLLRQFSSTGCSTQPIAKFESVGNVQPN
jgi:hypothetical protein